LGGGFVLFGRLAAGGRWRISLAWLENSLSLIPRHQKGQARCDFGNGTACTAEARYQSGSLDAEGQRGRVRILASGRDGRRYSGEGCRHAAAVSAWRWICEGFGFRL